MIRLYLIGFVLSLILGVILAAKSGGSDNTTGPEEVASCVLGFSLIWPLTLIVFGMFAFGALIDYLACGMGTKQ